MGTLPPPSPPPAPPAPPALSSRGQVWLRRLAWGLGATVFTLLALAAALVFVLARTLAAGPGEWARPVRLGPVERTVSMPALIRLATHPLGLRWLDGQTLATRIGTLHWRLAPDGQTLTATCAPCTLRLPELSREPLQWSRAEFSVARWSQNDFRGDLRIGDGEAAIRGRWTASLAASGMQLQFALAQAPIAHYYHLFEAGVPELARARLDGRARFDVQARLPEGQFQVRPVVEGFAVEGLGTEALLNAAPPLQCQVPARAGSDFGRWLPMAVVSAEDQRFFEHPGYDLVELEAAWRHNQALDDARRGASTITQQLAKILYSGDERTHVRKLRELLYAVEMERTLGKARILQLYLSLAPWGEGQCGGHAAARRWLGKRASALTPVEAAWLASLLRSPDAQIQSWRDTGEVDRRRVAGVLSGMRPSLPAWRRAQLETLKTWTPPAYAAVAPEVPVGAPVVGSPSGTSQRRTR